MTSVSTQLNIQQVYIIAEAGVNHNGQLDVALRMVDAAADSGADCIKFQTFHSEKLVSRFAVQAEYQKRNLGSEDASQLSMLRKLELAESDHFTLLEHCRTRGIQFLSTPFDMESLTLLNKLGMPFWKIPSGEITNLPYLMRIAATGKPVVLSTGMSTMAEIEACVTVLKKNGSGAITLLHCNTDYPTPFEDVNLRAMLTLHTAFNLPVGYSDHTTGIEVPIAATALGATVIEKHFTLDRSMPGPDHVASINPQELIQMVRSIRNITAALGSPEKMPSTSELKNIAIARKSIVAACTIRTGERFSEQNLAVKRPGSGISPMQWYAVLGQTARRDFEEDELIEL